MFNPNIIILKIIFDINNLDKTIIKTNAKKEAIKEILEAWLRYQIGKRKDKRKANKRDVYKITIQLDLSDDNFNTISDVGNDGLTSGIVMDVFSKLKKIKIGKLS